MRDKDLENNVNRRINLTEIDEEKYPKVVKAVNYLIEENDSVEKYLNQVYDNPGQKYSGLFFSRIKYEYIGGKRK